jgi:hypothetical protein
MNHHPSPITHSGLTGQQAAQQEQKMIKIKTAIAAGLALVSTGIAARAADADKWNVEVTPYLWAAGIDADLTIRGQEVTVDQKFKDLVEHVDAAGALLAVAEKGGWQVYGQGDYISLNVNDAQVGPLKADLDADTTILTGGIGPVFDGLFGEKSKIAVLLGARYTHLRNEVTVMGKSSGADNNDIVDGLLILRPRFNFTDKFRFSGTMNIGAGDSDLTYELQPELQYDITDAMSVRLGFRRVHYKEEFSDKSDFNGSMNGFLLGLGVTL